MHLVKQDLIINHLQETVSNDVNRLKGGKNKFMQTTTKRAE